MPAPGAHCYAGYASEPFHCRTVSSPSWAGARVRDFQMPPGRGGQASRTRAERERGRVCTTQLWCQLPPDALGFLPSWTLAPLQRLPGRPRLLLKSTCPRDAAPEHSCHVLGGAQSHTALHRKCRHHTPPPDVPTQT